MSTASTLLEFAAASTDSCPTTKRLVQAPIIRFSEIISALSVALDITQGHPQGHCMRSCLIGMRIADVLKLPQADCSALFYALLLKDLGCSSNAAKIAYLFGGDDLTIKRSTRMIDWTKPGQCLSHCWNNSAPGGSTIEKLIKMAAIVRKGAEGGRKISEIRCERGAEIARMLQLPESTSQAILDLDEHWNGGGNPCGRKGEEISLLGRICCLAQTVEVYFSTYGLDSAYDVAKKRRGKWFDPQLVDAMETFKRESNFWARLHSENLMAEISEWEPEDVIRLADDEALDQIAEAFSRVVDAKSPWTFQHSSRVSEIAVGMSKQFGCSPELEQDIRRAGLLHDIGKLGVSNLILDKPGKPTDEEFAEIRKHAEWSYQILNQVTALQQLADVAGAHHERLDGRGYHRGIAGPEIHFVARILTVADICEAMTAKRPYRDAMQWEQVQAILAKDAGKGVDHECLEALQQWYDRHTFGSRVDDQLAAVERLVSEL
ncbi:MAG: HD domain-containing phosphohydrolase [Planctomycetaceae bacterium]